MSPDWRAGRKFLSRRAFGMIVNKAGIHHRWTSTAIRLLFQEILDHRRSCGIPPQHVDFPFPDPSYCDNPPSGPFLFCRRHYQSSVTCYSLPSHRGYIFIKSGALVRTFVTHYASLLGVQMWRPLTIWGGGGEKVFVWIEISRILSLSLCGLFYFNDSIYSRPTPSSDPNCQNTKSDPIKSRMFWSGSLTSFTRGEGGGWKRTYSNVINHRRVLRFSWCYGQLQMKPYLLSFTHSVWTCVRSFWRFDQAQVPILFPFKATPQLFFFFF